MKPFVVVALLALTACIATSCSRSDDDRSAGARSEAETLPESEVVDIIEAVNATDVAKVTAMLQANPKLVRAKSTAGGPQSGWPLVMIASKNGSKPLVEVLLASGADVNEKNYSSEVALHYAALGGHTDVVRILLDHKADVNVKNDAGATALAAATSAGKPDIVALLKEHGATE